MAETAKANISIVIPNWNGRRWLGACLDSIYQQTMAPAEIIVVDDGSEDDSVEFVRRNHPEARLVALPDNRGFCETVNVGIRGAREEAIFLLNNDTRLHPECLRVLHRALLECPQADFFALRILRPDEITVESAGAAIGRDGRFFQRTETPDSRLQTPDPGLSTLDSTAVFGNSAGAGLYRRRLFEDIGLLDENFVMYHEDQDFNLRARLRGHLCFYLPEAMVYHLGSASLGRENPRAVSLLVRNHLMALAKDLPASLWLRNLPAILRAQVRSAIFYTLQGQGLLFSRAVAQAVRQWSALWKKRGTIQTERRVSTQEFRRSLEP